MYSLAANLATSSLRRNCPAKLLNELIFLQLPNAETAIARVAERVQQGGHDIPEATIRRRFSAGLQLFEQRYKPLVDVWLHFDISGESPILINWSENEPETS